METMSEQASRPDQHSPGNAGDWDTGTHAAFYDYYRDQSLSPQTMERFERVRDLLLRLIGPDAAGRPLKVADIGCGAGSQAWLWAKLGHHVSGLDINQPLIELARSRAGGLAATAEFTVGSATALPWPNESMDVCLVPELLEHVADWQAVVQEAARVTKPRGYLYLSTTNKLCPVQQEFELPAYSWYPGFLKRRYERLAVTSSAGTGELREISRRALVHVFRPCRIPRAAWLSLHGPLRPDGPARQRRGIAGRACCDTQAAATSLPRARRYAIHRTDRTQGTRNSIVIAGDGTSSGFPVMPRRSAST